MNQPDSLDDRIAAHTARVQAELERLGLSGQDGAEKVDGELPVDGDRKRHGVSRIKRRRFCYLCRLQSYDVPYTLERQGWRRVWVGAHMEHWACPKCAENEKGS